MTIELNACKLHMLGAAITHCVLVCVTMHSPITTTQRHQMYHWGSEECATSSGKLSLYLIYTVNDVKHSWCFHWWTNVYIQYCMAAGTVTCDWFQHMLIPIYQVRTRLSSRQGEWKVAKSALGIFADVGKVFQPSPSAKWHGKLHHCCHLLHSAYFCTLALIPFCTLALIPFCTLALIPFCTLTFIPFCTLALIPFCTLALMVLQLRHWLCSAGHTNMACV